MRGAGCGVRARGAGAGAGAAGDHIPALYLILSLSTPGAIMSFIQLMMAPMSFQHHGGGVTPSSASIPGAIMSFRQLAHDGANDISASRRGCHTPLRDYLKKQLFVGVKYSMYYGVIYLYK